MSAHPSRNSGDCGCGPDWRKPKLNGTCATCGGWLPGELPPALTAMWRGEPDETPRWLDLKDLPYHGGGTMGRR